MDKVLFFKCVIIHSPVSFYNVCGSEFTIMSSFCLLVVTVCYVTYDGHMVSDVSDIFFLIL